VNPAAVASGLQPVGSAPIRPTPIRPRDRLIATLALAAIVHGVLILGIGFTREDAAPVVPTLDVILTQTRTNTPPKQADFLAEANQQGGGDSDRALRPREAQLGEVVKPTPGIAPQPLTMQAPPPQPEQVQRVLTSTRAQRNVTPPQEAQPTTQLPLPTGHDLTELDLQMARKAEEIAREQQLYAKRPRRKFISASTQQYEYAGYMHSYVARIERIGNLNYPDEARRRNLSGRVMLNVAVRRDGSVESIEVQQSSGIPVLDAAAIQSVRLAEPFPPLPPTRDNEDVLNITRTWDWLPSGSLQTE
jgi:protein TonB